MKKVKNVTREIKVIKETKVNKDLKVKLVSEVYKVETVLLDHREKKERKEKTVQLS